MNRYVEIVREWQPTLVDDAAIDELLAALLPAIEDAAADAIAADRERCACIIEDAARRAHYDLRLHSASTMLAKRIRNGDSI